MSLLTADRSKSYPATEGLTSASCFRSRDRVTRQISLFSGIAFGLLSGCTSFGSASRFDKADDFIAYGASVHVASNVEQQAIYDEARAAYRSTPTAGSAIRLAVASLGVDVDLAAETLVLLEYAESNATSDNQRQFVDFLRPLVERLIELGSTIEFESAARRSLEAQLEALKALEEQLNAGADRR